MATLTLKGIDLDDWSRRLGSDTKLLHILLLGFADQFGGAMDLLRSHLRGHDRENARHVVHAIKGIAGNMSATSLHKVATALDRELRVAGAPEPLKLLEEFQVALDEVLATAADLALISDSTAAASPSELNVAAGATTRPVILLVDDQATNLQMLANLLEREGQVIMTSNGAEALSLAITEHPDVILLDVMMPGMNGYEVCRALKSDPRTRDVSVLFVTALTEETDEAQGLDLGAIDFITKPYSPAVVRARVRNHLALRRATKELISANRELTRLATTDPLTGAFNRRHFLDLCEREMGRARRYGLPATVLMLDIDHFKRINDTYGHDIGDRAIVRTVEVSRAALRNEDIFGRLGGEEFAAMLPQTPSSVAYDVADRLRRSLADVRIPSPLGEVAFTMSIGMTSIDPTSDTFAEALKRADKALYSAKQGGRDRVILA